MKNLVFAAVLVPALALGACQSVPSVDVTNLENQISQSTQAICGYVPAAETIANIVGALVPGGGSVVQIASDIANQICGAVTKPVTQSGKLGAVRRTVVVGGREIPVKGHFVR